MRTLELHGPKARYERIRLLDKAADYGFALDPQRTAPFTVAWNLAEQVPEVRLRHTVLASVDTRYQPPRLQIRDVVPQDCDAAILRALRNAADLGDEIGRIQRGEKAQKRTPAGAMFLPMAEARKFTLDGYGPEDIAKSLYGATALCEDTRVLSALQRKGFSHPVRFALKRNRGSVVVTLTEEKGVLTYTPQNYPIYHPNPEVLIPLLEKGRAHWDRHMHAARIEAACRDLIAQTRLDTETVDTAHRYARARKELVYDAVATFGPFRMSDAGTVHRGLGRLRYHGVVLTEDCARLAGLDLPLLVEANAAMMWRTRAAELGRTPDDFPVIDPDALRDAVAEVDFGYEM